MRNDTETLRQLYELSNPIIQYRIDKELRGLAVDHNAYVDYSDKLVEYWLKVYDGTQIHGALDKAFENAMGKLLDFGFNKQCHVFDEVCGQMTGSGYWNEGTSFNDQLNKTVIYPFLVRAGYLDDPKVQEFLEFRVEMIEKAIEKYGYDLERPESEKPSIHKNQFVFKNDIATECLPTIYDLYAFAYYPNKDDNMGRRMDKIIEYILDPRFLHLPDSGYAYDKSNQRYYASGNVYHACLRKERYLLFLYLLSFFEAAGKNEWYLEEIKSLDKYKVEQGFYIFSKDLIKEKKNTYQLYAGGHMGLGEYRRKGNAMLIESTFWMLSLRNNS